ASDASSSAIFTLLGLFLHDTTAQIDIECSPISATGLARANACQVQPVRCESNNTASVCVSGVQDAS
ncbi:uncharacterized protein BXZ73DRAFT_54448, partial [Epithele typhae]|uniref:uncharacterized protein n=1 Tax=Epithele typhae TaxID=378194 RepID=UPI0020086080